MAEFSRRSFAEIEGWGEADHGLAFDAFRRSASRLLEGAFPTGTLGLRAAAYRDPAEVALAAGDPSASEARDFFETRFVPLGIRPSRTETGFVTGYYEPVVEASARPDDRFRFPLYRPPDDLVKVDDVSRPPGLDPSYRFARRMDCGMLTEYFDRAAIETGALEGRGLEIVWLADRVDAFFIHIQGSARLVMQDGSHRRVGYAAKSGHPFTAIGRSLVEAGELTLGEADMQGIRSWLAAHPDRQDEILHRNRSFIFFHDRSVIDPELGPVGAAKVPLTPLASIAVDRELATYGLPYFIAARELAIDGQPFRRLMIAQDTGSAILGPRRADIFVGSGDEAGAIAGRIRHAADFTVLVPPELARDLVP
ncbi:murein transglycosylase A [Jiella marina]|uniref:murein transglycosylase A n=1 Tax=Jiella sp. LLJ827 TaxID=2917712 RepID=UPI002100BC8C|nr:MltA domain-containing protein [Jiella sp. LLJ827]MCQ0986846.1 MltA domain-containing protein [Jiella sp. LLJ827]